MWSGLLMLVLCCGAMSGVYSAVSGDVVEGSPGKEAHIGDKEDGSQRTEGKSAAVGWRENEPTPETAVLPGITEEKTPGKGAQFRDADQQPTAEPLEDELDNQENIMTQLLGDYDKVKIVSSGSDCVCRCIVRPIKRSVCDSIHDDGPAMPSQDFYTIETVTKGTDCRKCVCMAPPSAVNPCEGEYRFKKLQEAGRDIQLSTIMDLLEGSLYGIDLLKLHSVTTKLLNRVDSMEKAFSRNYTERVREKEREKERVREKEREKEKRAQQRQEKKKKLNNAERSAQRKNEERHVGGQLKKSQSQERLELQQPIRNRTGTQQPIKDKTELQQPIKVKNSVVIRGVTFYKAEGGSEGEEEEKRGGGGEEAGTDVSVDLLISDQLPPSTPPSTPPLLSQTPGGAARKPVISTANLQPTTVPTTPKPVTTTTPKPVTTTTPKPVTTTTPKPVTTTTPKPVTTTTPKPVTTTTPKPVTTTTPKPVTTTTPKPVTTTTSKPVTKATPKPVTTITPKPVTTTKPTTTTAKLSTTTKPTTTKSTTTKPTTNESTTTKRTTTTTITTTKATTATTTVKPTTTNAPPPPPPVTHPNNPPSGAGVSPPLVASPMATPSSPATRSQLSWTESPADRQKTTKQPGVCKDTVASIAEPVQQNSYGRSEGAWMRDPRGHGNVIYLTNGHYGNNLLEFRDMDTFKTGQASNSYKLPYSFTGTGHVVYNGAFYYNRAFSRDVVRYDLRHRYVAAWTTLHDALLEEQVHNTHTEVEFAVDESGLWLLYPALDTEGFHQEVILLTQLRPRDLQPIRSFRTGLRRGRYGDSFLVCGVLYAVDNTERFHANVTYAFDTHTLTHTVPLLAFTNMHTHTSQLTYCPLDKKLYGWDNGHQMTYDVIFAY